MSDENEDHISRVQKHSSVRFGRERTPAEMAQDFALYSPHAREQLLVDLKPPAAMSVTEASKRWAMERALRSTDARLRRVGK